MSSTSSLSSSTLKLDPATATGLIARGADAGAQAAAAGAITETSTAGGQSPIDVAVIEVRAEGLAHKGGWIAAATTKSVRRGTGEADGVAAMSEQEQDNTARLAQIGPEGAKG